jgi:glycosyltransferase involved in cell wall biosynthesis
LPTNRLRERRTVNAAMLLDELDQYLGSIFLILRCCLKSNFRERLRQPSCVPQVCDGTGEPDLVSVLIPTYNRDYILPLAIESVLAQTYRSFEVIVVDDGSNDKTRQLVENLDPKVRYIYQENAGLASARNTGLAMARGEFIAFQDSDDLWEPWKLEVQVALMRRYPQVAISWTDVTCVNQKGELVGERLLAKILGAYGKINSSQTFSVSGVVKDLCPACPPELSGESYRCGNIFSAMTFGNLVHPPTALMRRQSIQAIGGEDTNFTNCGEDYEFFWRLARTGWGAMIDCPGMLYRIGADDQYSKPGSSLPVSYGYLYAIKGRLKADRPSLELSNSEIRRCLADANAWVGEEELRSPQGRWSPGYAFKSLWLNPLQLRMLFLLPFCIVPPFFRLALGMKRLVKRMLARRNG